MKEELVPMDDNKKKQTEADLPVSVNTQMMIGVVIVGVMMFRFNQKLNVLARSQMTLTEGVKYLAEGVTAIDEDLTNFINGTTEVIVEETT